MAKKPKDPENPSASEAVQSLFSHNNPFRRKPQSDSTPPPPPPAELGLGLDISPSDFGTKRRQESDQPSSSNKRKKKLEENEEGIKESPRKKRKKRKRGELEEEYERRKLGAGGEVSEEKKDDEIKLPTVGEKRKAADMALEIVDSKEEAFDGEEKLLRTVFVGNLPLKIKKKVLVKEFGRFGEIESVRIRSVPLVDSKIPRKGAIIKGKINDTVDSVHAYIVFKDEQSARASLSRNMTEVGGNHIRVDMACPPRKKLKGAAPLYDRKRTVFVGNLPFDVKDEELYRLFCSTSQSVSSVEAVRVIRDPNTSLGKGIAYILFKTRADANSVAEQRGLKIRDRLLRLCHAKSDATPSKSPSKRKIQVQNRDFPHKKLASNYGEASMGSKNEPKSKATSLSYQGLRASKSGAVKKSVGSRPRPESFAYRGEKRAAGADQKTRKAKRPAVAARKAKLKKRKQDSGTPVNTHRNKKARTQ